MAVVVELELREEASLMKVAAEDNKCNWRLGKYSPGTMKRLGDPSLS
jgi:hypothetical protein